MATIRASGAGSYISEMLTSGSRPELKLEPKACGNLRCSFFSVIFFLIYSAPLWKT